MLHVRISEDLMAGIKQYLLLSPGYCGFSIRKEMYFLTLNTRGHTPYFIQNYGRKTKLWKQGLNQINLMIKGAIISLILLLLHIEFLL